MSFQSSADLAKIAVFENEILERARLKRLKEANDRATLTQTRRGPTLAGGALQPATVRASLLGGVGDSQSLLAGA